MATRKRWSQQVTEHSDAMTLDEGVFKRKPVEIARSLKRSAERSHRRKSTPFRSAMSMLTFYANRAGRSLSAPQKRKLEAAKEELRKLYGKQESTTKAVRNSASTRKPRKKTAATRQKTVRKNRSSAAATSRRKKPD